MAALVVAYTATASIDMRSNPCNEPVNIDKGKHQVETIT